MRTTENNIFDYLARNGFVLEDAVKFASLNDVSITDELTTIEYNVTGFLKAENLLKYKETKQAVAPDVYVMEYQSNFDLAIQMTGSMEGIIELLGEASITDLKPIGAKLVPHVIHDLKVFKYYLKHDIHPATWFENEPLQEGIDFMIIEDTFIIK